MASDFIDPTPTSLPEQQPLATVPKKRRLRKAADAEDDSQALAPLPQPQAESENIQPNLIIQQQPQESEPEKVAPVPENVMEPQQKSVLEPILEEDEPPIEDESILKDPEAVPQAENENLNVTEPVEEEIFNLHRDGEAEEVEQKLDPVVPLLENPEDISISRALRPRAKCKNKLIGEIEDTSIFTDAVQPIPEEERLINATLEIDTKNRKKKSLGEFLSKIVGPEATKPMSPVSEPIKNETQVTVAVPEAVAGAGNRAPENEAKPAAAPAETVEVACTETFTESKPMMMLNAPPLEEKVDEIEIITPEPVIPQLVPDRAKLLTQLAEASKKRRSKNLTFTAIKDLVQCTELVSSKGSGMIFFVNAAAAFCGFKQ